MSVYWVQIFRLSLKCTFFNSLIKTTLYNYFKGFKMLININDFLFNDVPLKVDEHSVVVKEDIQLAVASLIVKAMLDPEGKERCEFESLVETLIIELELSSPESVEFKQICRVLRNTPQKCNCLVEIVNKHLSVNNKIAVLETVWKVIIADGVLKEYESDYARDLRRDLDLTLEQAMLAQHRAMDNVTSSRRNG
jgi:uncharacterized tellurite resistance protein B-like protein